MPCSRAAQSKGGQQPASAHQRQVAREWAIAHKPWQGSTGPRSHVGKAVACQNSTRHGLYRWLPNLTAEEIAAQQTDPFCRAVRYRLEELEGKHRREAVATRERLRTILKPILRHSNEFTD